MKLQAWYIYPWWFIPISENETIIQFSGRNLRKQAATNCDYVILVGEKQAKPIYDGLVEENFDKDKIFIVNNFDEAREKMNNIMDSETVILLENDLTDNYL